MRLPRVLGLVGLALALAQGCSRRSPLVAFLGDSLTSGWRLPESQAYPAQVQRELRQKGRPLRVINAGVSGDTVAQGLKRLPALLRRRPDVLVVALGINDGLRGLPPETTERGLRQILTLAQAARVRVLLCGFRIPPRFGEEHARAFGAIYPRLAGEFRVPLVPLLLEGVAGQPSLHYADGLHPTAEGHRRVAANVRAPLELLLAEVTPP
ncbi:MAG: arylesterase [Acidobacteria bacterium]|nr:MAG: arylesterase [Acidobacteriota bacterium]